MSKTSYVLDTNILLHDPEAIHDFEDHTIILPIYVLEELDRFKNEQNELGRNARHISRYLDALRSEGDLVSGIENDQGGKVVVSLDRKKLDHFVVDCDATDNKIIGVALKEQERNPNTIMVSNDINLRIRASAFGLEAQGYSTDRIQDDQLPTHKNLVLESHEIDLFYSQGYLDEVEEGYPNQYAILSDGFKKSALGRYDKKGETIRKLMCPDAVWGLSPRNKEQRFAFDALLDDSIKLVVLKGIAGTGKTILALSAALQKVVEDQRYSKILASRPVIPMGKDIGFLPGTIEEKMDPWMKPIYDNIDYLMGFTDKEKRNGRNHSELIDLGYIEIEALTYIRGRSIPNQFIILDEAQNLSQHEIKTIVTRVGEGTKLILTGDPDQIDSPYLDKTSNGLVHVMDRFKNSGLAASVTLEKGERSDLAREASALL